MARERFDLNLARKGRTPPAGKCGYQQGADKKIKKMGCLNTLEDDVVTLNNVWDEEHDVFNMVARRRLQ